MMRWLKIFLNWFCALFKFSCRLVLFAVLIASLAGFYLLTLITVDKQSFSFFNDKVRNFIAQNVSDKIVIGDIFVQFNSRLHFILTFDKVGFIESSSKSKVTIDKIETEFSALDLIRADFIPLDTELDGFNLRLNLPATKNNKTEVKNIDLVEQKIDNSGSILLSYFDILNQKSDKIDSFLINDANIVVNKNGKTTNYKLDDWKVVLNKKADILTVTSSTSLSFNQSNFKDIRLSCIYFDNAKCNILFSDLDWQKITQFYPKLTNLAKITGKFNGNFHFIVNKKNQLEELDLLINASEGEILVNDFFDQALEFYGFSLNLNTTNDFKQANALFRINFIDDFNFKIDAKINDFLEENPSVKVKIASERVEVGLIKKYWPNLTKTDKIRDWVVKSLDGGSANGVYINFDYIDNLIQNIDANFLIKNVVLKYSEKFPNVKINELIADFNKDNLSFNLKNVKIANGYVNGSKVNISNFSKNGKAILDIDANFTGFASDIVSHIKFEKEFIDHFQKYLNGNANANFKLRLPIKNEINFINDITLTGNVQLKKINSYFLINDSKMTINLNKKVNSNVINFDIDGSDADIVVSNVALKSKGNNRINFALKINPDSILIDSLTFKNGKGLDLLGSIKFNLEPEFYLSQAHLEKFQYQKNDFWLKYDYDYQKSRNIVLNAKAINLGYLLENYAPIGEFENENEQTKKAISINKIEQKTFNIKNNIAISSPIIFLQDGYLSNFEVVANCNDLICQDGYFVADFKDQQDKMIDVKFSNYKNKSTSFEGAVKDLGLLLSALGLPKKLNDAKAIIKGNIFDDNGLALEGKIKIADKFYFMHDFAKIDENVFSQIGRKILKINDNQIRFDSAKMAFELKNGIFMIKNFVTKSKRLGVTAKGKIDLSHKDTEIEGVIIPAYLVNNLFGIGSIPIISDILVGDKGGGVFVVEYVYKKNSKYPDGDLKIKPISTIAPGSTRKIFNAIEDSVKFFLRLE